MPYFPAIASARTCARYELGEHRVVLLDQIRSAQRIQYYTAIDSPRKPWWKFW